MNIPEAMRISVTALDSYKYYCESEMEFSDYLEQLLGKTPPTDAMKIGTAFHSILERWGEDGETDFKELMEVDGWKFQWKPREPDCEVFLLKPDAVEIPVTRDYTVNHAFGETTITLSGRIDAVAGNIGVDYKTTRAANAEKYLDAMQWRAYLAMYPDLESFQYDVFEMYQPAPLAERCDNHRKANDYDEPLRRT